MQYTTFHAPTSETEQIAPGKVVTNSTKIVNNLKMTNTTLTPDEINRRYQATITLLAKMVAELPAAAIKSEDAEIRAELVSALDRSIQ